MFSIFSKVQSSIYSDLRFEEIEQHWVTRKIDDGFKYIKSCFNFVRFNVVRIVWRKNFWLHCFSISSASLQNVVLHTLNACEDFIEDILNYVCM